MAGETLVRVLRALINDPAGENQVFSTSELKIFLSQNCFPQEEEELIPEYSEDGIYKKFYSVNRNWDDTESKLYQGGSEIVPYQADFINGVFEFEEGVSLPIYLIGNRYDLNASAADALTAWANKLALQFSFSADGMSFNLGQKREALLELAKFYRLQAFPRMGRQGRNDDCS